MSREQNIAAQSLGGEILASGDFDRLGEVFSAGVVDHDPSAGQAPGVEGVKQFWRGIKGSFPDFRLEVDLLTASDDGRHPRRSVHGRCRDREAFRGSWCLGGQVARFEHGLITDRWGSSDSLGMLSQLAIVMPGAGAP